MVRMHRLTTFITAKKTSWIVLVIAALAAGAIFALGSGSTGQTSPGVGLPDSAESARVAALQEKLPGADSTAALLVFSKDGAKLSTNDLAAIATAGKNLTDFSKDGFVPPATVSDD